MFLKKLSILFAVVLVLFSCSIHTTSALNSIAPTKQSSEIIDELDRVDNQMYLIIKTICRDTFKKEDVKKEVKFVDILIKDLNSKSSNFPNSHLDVSLSLRAMLNVYSLSLLEIDDYLESNNPDDLINAISTFSIVHNSSATFKKFINEAR